MDRVKAALNSEFGIKDLCEAECFEHSDSEKASGELFISQRAYSLNVLARFNIPGCKAASISMEVGLQSQYSDTEAQPEFQMKYLQAIGSLLYANQGSRPDLAFAVIYFGWSASRPNSSPLVSSPASTSVKHIKGTLDNGIFYSQDDSPLTGSSAHSDSDW